jgi:hypothetical protein
MRFHRTGLASQHLLKIIHHWTVMGNGSILLYKEKGEGINLHVAENLLAQNNKVMFFLKTNSLDFNFYVLILIVHFHQSPTNFIS